MGRVRVPATMPAVLGPSHRPTSTSSGSHTRRCGGVIEIPDGYELATSVTRRRTRARRCVSPPPLIRAPASVPPSILGPPCAQARATPTLLGSLHWIVSESQTQCYLLLSLRSPVPTFSASYSFRRINLPATEGYAAVLRCDTFDNPSVLSRR